MTSNMHYNMHTTAPTPQAGSSFARFKHALMVSCLPFFLVSCAFYGKEDNQTAKRAMDTLVAESSKPPLNIPDEVNQSLLSRSYAAPVQTAERRFNVSVNQVPARAFFVSVVADAGVNVVAHPEVEGAISLELNDVTIQEVLEITRDVYGYEYKFANNIYTIYPRKLRTEIFPINYLDVQRVGVTDTSVQVGKISSSGGGGNNRGSGGNSGKSGSSSGGDEGANLLGYLDGESGGKGGQSITPGARVQTLSKTDFWYGLNQALLAIVGNGGDRTVMVNPQSGLVLVKALPNELSAVRDFLDKSEISIKRQVVLETKILEVRLHEGFEAGINWGAISGEIAMAQQDTSTGSLGDILAGNDVNGQRDSVVSSVLNITDITKLLFLLEQQGDVQVLSSPRISTVNNQKAVIRVGTDEFFVTGISNSTTAGTAAVVSTPQVELDSFFSGIALDVTPQISENGEVILHVHPMVTDVKDQRKEIDIGDDKFSLPLALREVRESDSIVRAQNGQVVVLGGLMQESLSYVDTKRAFLGDIPVINLLFKAKQRSKIKTELVILMRPIVVDEDTWNNQLQEQSLRINALSNSGSSR